MENGICDTKLFFSLKQLPEKNIHVIVICQSFRYLGYTDAEGIWKSAYSNQRLDNVIGWCSTD